MNSKLQATILTFVKFMVYTTVTNLAVTMPAHDNPLFWKLLGASAIAAAIKAVMTFIATETKL